MQDIEPFYSWRHLYIAAEDELSPFFGTEYSEFEYTHTIYNYYIHPQWDDFGSPTLYIKILFADYDNGFAICELIGEWNDAINNDIMFLKRDVADEMMNKGIHKFILIGENVLNFHLSDDCYYQEWSDDVSDSAGWVMCINFRDHVVREFERGGIDSFINFCGEFEDVNWRVTKPQQLFEMAEQVIKYRLH